MIDCKELNMIGSLLGYIGPETALPFLSVVAAIFGAVMMMGKTATRFLVRRFLGLFGIRAAEPTVEATNSDTTGE